MLAAAAGLLSLAAVVATPSAAPPLRVACTASAANARWDSYHARCTTFAYLVGAFGSGRVSLSALGKFPNRVGPAAAYDATVFIKCLPPRGADVTNLGRIVVDVVDNMNLRPSTTPRHYAIIVQSAYQVPIWNRTHTVSVVEHAPAMLNASSPLPDDDLLATRPISAATIMEEVDASSYCMDVGPPSRSFTYECIVTRQRERAALFRDRLGIDYEALGASPWGVGYAFDRLLRSFDAIVVYTKQAGGRGHRNDDMGTVQRMTNALTSGVVTVVQRTGVHTLYVPEAYPCGFTDAVSLRRVLTALTEEKLREDCRRQGRAIQEPLRVRAIVRKFERFVMELRGE